MKKSLGLLVTLLLIGGTVTALTQIECNVEKISRKGRKKKPAPAPQPNPLPAIVKSVSTNWSGYVAYPSNSYSAVVSSVSGSWTVPNLIATPDDSSTAIWVGIDGYTSSTVEQIGTSHDWVSGQLQSYAWFEMYPQGSFQIQDFPVNVGDQITASVTFQPSTSNYNMVITNHTQDVTTTVPEHYTQSFRGRRNSAEWIVEAPFDGTILPLSDFNTVTFTNCQTTFGGVTGTIQNANWQTDQLTMQDDQGNVKAAVSDLIDEGSAFTVSWQHE